MNTERRTAISEGITIPIIPALADNISTVLKLKKIIQFPPEIAISIPAPEGRTSASPSALFPHQIGLVSRTMISRLSSSSAKGQHSSVTPGPEHRGKASAPRSRPPPPHKEPEPRRDTPNPLRRPPDRAGAPWPRSPALIAPAGQRRLRRPRMTPGPGAPHPGTPRPGPPHARRGGRSAAERSAMSTDGNGGGHGHGRERGRGAAPGEAGLGRAGSDAPRCFSDLIETFRAQLRDDPDVSSAVAAIRALLGFLKQDRGGLGGPRGDPAEPRLSPGRGADHASLPLPRRDHPGPAEQPAGRHRHLVAGGLLGGRVLRRGALPALHQPHLAGVLGKGCPAVPRCCCGTLRPLTGHPAPSQDYSKCKEIMIERGEIFLRKVSLSRNKIAKLCHPFIRDDAVSRPGQGRSCWVLQVREEQEGRGV